MLTTPQPDGASPSGPQRESRHPKATARAVSGRFFYVWGVTCVTTSPPPLRSG